MKIRELVVIDYFPYLEVESAQQADGTAVLTNQVLPIYKGYYEAEEEAPDYLLLSADLQGLVKEGDTYQLMGTILPTYLQLLLEETCTLNEEHIVGVILGGDLYTDPRKRGASGDVRIVWEAFDAAFDWVAGVAGNHDTFGGKDEEEAFLNKEILLLHKSKAIFGGLAIGGISGIIGNPAKAQRTEEGEYLQHLERLLKQSLDLLVLHETPDYVPLGFLGNEKIRSVLERSKQITTVISGHCHWEEPLAVLENGTTVINVDARVLILEKS